MPTEQLILRRSYPVPVTFADLRVARDFLPFTRGMWHNAIKEATGATDDIFAVIDGREVRVATVTGSGESATANIFGCISAGQAARLLIAADEAGYWGRPHEVRHVLEESQMSHKTMTRIAANSIAAAGAK